MVDKTFDTDCRVVISQKSHLGFAYDSRGRRRPIRPGKGGMHGLSHEEYFWANVEPMMDDRGCWEFAGARFKRGYGRITDGLYAHRLSWEIHNDRKLERKEVVMHLCDNVSCVNPAHLRVGTQQENMDDKVAKGRHPKFGLGDDDPCPSGHVRTFRRYWKKNPTTGKRYWCCTCLACADARKAAA